MQLPAGSWPCDRAHYTRMCTHQLLLGGGVLLLQFGELLLVLVLVGLVGLDNLLLFLGGSSAVGGSGLGGGWCCDVGHGCCAVNWADELTEKYSGGERSARPK
jgi:hypothetical protein